jgi:hypothetical protein
MNEKGRRFSRLTQMLAIKICVICVNLCPIFKGEIEVGWSEKSNLNEKER